MERVTGVGGFFFRAEDPGALSRWYAERLGVPAPPTEYGGESWWHEAGPSVLVPMPLDSPHIRPGRQWTLNLRVRDLDAMVAQLRGDGVEVRVDPETYPNGRFADLEDPEGNPVQLWEPAPGDLEPPEA